MNLAHEVVLANSSDENPITLLQQRIRGAWLSGDYPWLRYKYVMPAKLSAPMLHPAGTVMISAKMGYDHAMIQQGPRGEWMLYSEREARRSSFAELTFFVVAKDDETAKAVMRKMTRGAKHVYPPSVPDPTRITVKFWFMAPDGPKQYTRMISVPSWDEIRGNYTGSLQEPVSRLVGMTPATLTGRVILLHGAPGTGKTTLLRALGREWQRWCDVTYILDPESLLNDGTYMMQMLLKSGDDNRWNLIIMEDAGELFLADAREESGQALSRLLNMTDGMLGQGTNLLFALSTNERVTDLHAAVMRPGRALADLSVPALSPDESAVWLDGVPHDGESQLTLAELYAIRSPETNGVVSNSPGGLLVSVG